MTEPQAPDSAQDQGTPTEPDSAPADQGKEPDDKTDWKAESRKWEQRSKENAAAAKEAEKLRKQAMTTDERALSEAEERGRTGAATEFGRELARERFDALAGRRNPDVNTNDVLEFVDLAKFLGDDGRPDSKSIEAAVKRLVPEPSGTGPSLDLGARGGSPTGDSMNALIRRAAGRT